MSTFNVASGPDEKGQWGTVSGLPITDDTIDALVADAEAGFPNASISQLSDDADRTSTSSEEKSDDPRSDEILVTAQRVRQGQERTYTVDEVEAILALDDSATDQQAE